MGRPSPMRARSCPGNGKRLSAGSHRMKVGARAVGAMDKEAARIEHLKAIQQVIERLTRSSFAIKAVASTITAATVAAIAVTSTPIVGLGGLSLLSLWGIDASRERRFRSLFDRVRIGPAPEFGDQTFFTMATWGDGESMFKVAVSPTLVALYIPLMLVVGGTALVVAAF
jgi:hypothetical protein